jgi:hypothetical protein
MNGPDRAGIEFTAAFPGLRPGLVEATLQVARQTRTRDTLLKHARVL